MNSGRVTGRPHVEILSLITDQLAGHSGFRGRHTSAREVPGALLNGPAWALLPLACWGSPSGTSKGLETGVPTTLNFSFWLWMTPADIFIFVAKDVTSLLLGASVRLRAGCETQTHVGSSPADFIAYVIRINGKHHFDYLWLALT